MIDKGSFEKAVGIADLFAVKGLQVAPVSGTPLAHLVGQTNQMGELPPMGAESDFVADDSISLTTLSDNDAHNALFDDYVEVLSNGLASQINIAKNVVNPVIQDAVDKIVSVTQGNNFSEYSFEIIPVVMPGPINNESLISEILANAEGSTFDSISPITLAGNTVEDVVAAMATGSELFDGLVREWLTTKGEDWIMSLWANTFASIETTNLEIRPDITPFLAGSGKLDLALGVYLVARRLMNCEVPENITMSLSKWRETVRDYLTVSSKAIRYDYGTHTNGISNKTLVKFYDAKNKQVHVYMDTYSSYISAGGKNEIIFGAIVDDKVPTYVTPLIENMEHYQRVWDRYASINREAVKLNTFNAFKEITESVLIGQLSDLVDFEKQKVLENNSFVNVIAQNYRKAIRMLMIEDMANINHTVMRLVCGARFPYTNSYRFLDTINDICENDPNLDPREAALIATVEVLCDHLTDQMVVTQ